MNNIEDQISEKVPPNRGKLLYVLLISFGVLIYSSIQICPPTVIFSNQLMSDCPTEVYKDLNYTCGQYDRDGLVTFAFKTDSHSSQFINLDMEPYLSEKAQSQGFPLNFETSVYAVSPINRIISKIHQERKWLNFECNDGDSYCSRQTIDRITDLSYESYIFVLKIFNLKELQDKRVEDLRFSLVSFNGVFQSYIRSFKWVLFIISIIGYIFYRGTLSSLPKGFATTEQTVVGYLALSLILFTQPIIQFYEYHYLDYTMLRVIGITIPHSIIVFLWFVLIERLAASVNGTSEISNKIKYFALVIALIHFAYLTYICGSLDSGQVTSMLLDFKQAVDPRLANYSYYSTAFSVLLAIWSILRIWKIASKLSDLNWRDCTALMFTFTFIITSLFFIWTHSFQVQTLTNNRVVLLYGITVLYGILLQVIYVPLSIEIEDAEKKMKYDNPGAKAKYSDLDGSDINSPTDVQLRNADEMKHKTDDFEEN